MSHNDGVVTGGASQSAAIASLLRGASQFVRSTTGSAYVHELLRRALLTNLLDVAHNGTLRHLAQGLHVAHGQDGLLAAVHELHTGSQVNSECQENS